MWLRKGWAVANGNKDNKESEISETWETSKRSPVTLKDRFGKKKYWDYILDEE